MFVAASNGDGTPYVTELENDSVIFWNFSSVLDEQSFSVSKFFLNQFKLEYERHDNRM